MLKFAYTPNSSLKVHEEGAIRLLCRAFRSHENGLPEWCKNSSDQYVRENCHPDQRVIVLFFTNRKGNRPASIACLDFCGMTSKTIESKFRIWADPNAANVDSSSRDIQGGHGNGGKCYMTQMFEDYSYLFTVRNGKGSHYGVPSNSVQFGWIPSPEDGKDFLVRDMRSTLGAALSNIGVKIEDLPGTAQESLSLANGFTLVVGVNPKECGAKLPVTEIVESISSHHQMIKTIQLCKVFVVADGKRINQGQALNLPDIPPIEGTSDPRVIVIPELLRDPRYDKDVSTTSNGALKQGTLILRTSDKSMRWKRQWRHTVTYKAVSGFIGFVEVPKLGLLSPYTEKIYGDCLLDSLEDYKQNDRGPLADSQLTRAVEKWIGEQIDYYAKEFEQKDKRRIDQEEKNALGKMNEALDRWKNRFLKNMIDAMWGPGREGGPPTPPPLLPSGKPTKLDLTLTHNRAGVGVSIRPVLKFFDAKGRRIRPVSYRWVSDDTNIAFVDEDQGLINTFAFGETQVYAETLDGKVRSNSVPLEVVHVYDIKVVPEHLELAAGTRGSLTAICTLKTGEQTSAIYLIWTEGNSKVARVSASGNVFCYQQGETEVFAGDNHCLSKTPAKVVVTQGGEGGPGSGRGRGFPRILISEIDKDPETNEDVSLTNEHPPVYQRVQDVERNIWWINSASPFARLYLNKSRGYGVDSREWRIYVLERYLEVMVKILLNFDVTQGEELSFENWMQRWDETAASMQQFASESLSSFIDSGILPEE